MKLVKKFEKWGLHHRIGAFIVIMIATIALVRLAVQIHDPTPIIFNFELHHFDYGILLLIITCLLLLFYKEHFPLHLLMSGVGIGLIIDDLWFIRTSVNVTGTNETQIYNSTFLSAVILSVFIILVVLLIKHYQKRGLLDKVRNKW